MRFTLLLIPLLMISCNGRNENKKPQEANNSKPELTKLALEKSKNDTLELGSITNVDRINGFRKLKLGLHMDSIQHLDWQSDTLRKKYGIQELFLPNQYGMSIGRDKILNIKLTFYKSLLYEIELSMDIKNSWNTGQLGVLDILTNTYGDPNYSNGIRNKAKSNEGQTSKSEIAYGEIDYPYEIVKEWKTEENSIVLKKFEDKVIKNDGSESFFSYTSLGYKKNELEHILKDIIAVEERDKDNVQKTIDRNSMNEI